MRNLEPIYSFPIISNGFLLKMCRPNSIERESDLKISVDYQCISGIPWTEKWGRARIRREGVRSSALQRL
jgi:hypothetical protein